jgi:hypothetical protein
MELLPSFSVYTHRIGASDETKMPEGLPISIFTKDKDQIGEGGQQCVI